VDELKKIKLGWWSAGITSAVACKAALELYDNVELYYIETGKAHPDNARFKTDCEKWYGKEVKTVQNSKGYKDPIDVIRKTRYVNGPSGARCTLELKKQVRYELEQQFTASLFNDTTLTNQVFGFEWDRKQVNRAIRFIEQYPATNPLFPLIEKGLNKDQCAGMIMSAGIELPVMYKLGYPNNNCIGCVKGGKGYWNKIRVDFPEVFEDMAKAEREVGHSCIKDTFLDELDPTEGNKIKIVMPNCGNICDVEFSEIESNHLDDVLAGKLNIYQLKNAA
jgi:hypothetical protein